MEACLSAYTEGARTRVARRNAETGPHFASTISTDNPVVYARPIYTASIIARNTTAGTVTPINSVNTISDTENARSAKSRDYTHTHPTISMLVKKIEIIFYLAIYQHLKTIIYKKL